MFANQGGKSADDVAGLENRHPFERRLGRDADVGGERGGVERLRRASGAEAQKPEEIGKMADIEQIADVSFKIGLDIEGNCLHRRQSLVVDATAAGKCQCKIYS